MNAADLATARAQSAEVVAAFTAPVGFAQHLTALAEHLIAHPELDDDQIYGVMPKYTGGLEIRLLGRATADALRAWAVTFDQFTTSAKRIGRADDPGKHVAGKVSARLAGFTIEIIGTLPSDEFPPENGDYDWSPVPLDPPAVTG